MHEESGSNPAGDAVLPSHPVGQILEAAAVVAHQAEQALKRSNDPVTARMGTRLDVELFRLRKISHRPLPRAGADCVGHV